MKYRATRSFCGLVTMSKDQVKEIKDKAIVNDLLNAGYIVKVDTRKKGEQNGKRTNERENQNA